MTELAEVKASRERIVDGDFRKGHKVAEVFPEHGILQQFEVAGFQRPHITRPLMTTGEEAMHVFVEQTEPTLSR